MATLFGKRTRESISSKSVTDDNGNRKEAYQSEQSPDLPSHCSFADLGLSETLVSTCSELGLKRPTAVQRSIIPYLIRFQDKHVLSLAPTGTGKTAAFVLPIIHHLQEDPYGIFSVILTPTRELAQQIHQQVLALGSGYNVTSALVVGGLDRLRQQEALDCRPHFCVATPGRLASLLRGPQPPAIRHLRYLVLDEADRLLKADSGFYKDVAEVLIQVGKGKAVCQTLLFSATMTQSLEAVEALAGAGQGRLSLQKFVAAEGNESKNDVTSENKNDGSEIPKIPSGLRQEYIFMPSRVRDTYLVAAVRHLMINGGRPITEDSMPGSDEEDEDFGKARSAIIFVSTCEKAALISGTFTQLGVPNVALHSYLSQNRRLASLAKFKSRQVSVLVATDVASRGLDIPTVDLVLQSQLPRQPTSYVHRVGRTARAGRRGLAVSLVSEADVALVNAAETASGRKLEKCTDVDDDMAVRLLGPVSKAIRLAKIKLHDIGFDELVEKFQKRKRSEKKERRRIQRRLDHSTNKAEPSKQMKAV